MFLNSEADDMKITWQRSCYIGLSWVLFLQITDIISWFFFTDKIWPILQFISSKKLGHFKKCFISHFEADLLQRPQLGVQHWQCEKHEHSFCVCLIYACTNSSDISQGFRIYELCGWIMLSSYFDNVFNYRWWETERDEFRMGCAECRKYAKKELLALETDYSQPDLLVASSLMDLLCEINIYA